MRLAVRLHIKAKKHPVDVSDEPMRCPFRMNCLCSTCRLTLIPGEWSANKKLTIRSVDFWIARDTSAVGNGKQRKATSADREPHDYCGRPVLYRMALWRGSEL